LKKTRKGHPQQGYKHHNLNGAKLKNMYPYKEATYLEFYQSHLNQGEKKLLYGK
jgi:hypothetical protein